MSRDVLLGLNMYWQLPVLVLIISLVYSATRYDQWAAIAKETMRWALNMSVFLVAIGVVLFLLATFI